MDRNSPPERQIVIHISRSHLCKMLHCLSPLDSNSKYLIYKLFFFILERRQHTIYNFKRVIIVKKILKSKKQLLTEQIEPILRCITLHLIEKTCLNNRRHSCRVIKLKEVSYISSMKKCMSGHCQNNTGFSLSKNELISIYVYKYLESPV